MSLLPSSPNPDRSHPIPANRWPIPTSSPEWYPAQTQPPSQFLEYLHILRANLGWICILGITGAGIGWLVAMLKPSMYQARTVLDIRSLNENFLDSREGSPIGTTTGSVLPESYIQTEIKILSSDTLRNRAMGRLQPPKPTAESKDSGSLVQALFDWLRPAAIPFGTLAADAARRVKVRAVGNTRIVEVLCDARDGQLAASMCNNLAKTYIEYNLESRSQSTRETADWLQSQLDDVRKRLTKSESELKDSFKEAAFLSDSASADNPAQDKLRVLQTELSRSEAERISKETDYVVASSRPADSLPLSLDTGPIRDYRMRLAELQRQYAELSATMTPEHYKVRELALQIAEVERSINKERDDLIQRVKADLDAAKRRESVFTSAYEQQAQKVSENGDKAVRYNMLKRDVDSDRKLYETLLQKVDEVGLAAALHTSTINVVDAAAVPSVPYSPNLLANIGIGLLGGWLLGLCFSFLRVRSDRTLRGPGDAAFCLQLRELGVIPSVPNPRFSLLVGRMRAASRRSLEPSLIPREIEDPVTSQVPDVSVPRSFPTSVALATWLGISEMTEAIFGTMSSLRFATERGNRADVIVVTSPEAGEGKTTVATNLAIALSQIGRRVVLVDGDLRKPRIDHIFGIDCGTGLADLLDAEDQIETNLGNFLYPTAVPNLTLLPTKAAREGICTKIHSLRIRLLLARLRKEFDSVVIDTPPMLHIADARVLGWLADGAVLVLRAHRTTRDSALAAYECLVQDGTHVLGTVLNDWNPRRSEKYAAYHSYVRNGRQTAA